MVLARASTTGRRRWWTVGLVVHACLVVLVLVCDPPSPTSGAWPARADVAATLALGVPWWLLAVPLALTGASASTVTRLLEGVPVVADLALHAGALLVVARRAARRRAGRGAERTSLSASTALFVAAALGVLVWGAWLGWDDDASYDVVTGRVESPYVSLQVLGCAVSVGAVTAVMAHRWSPWASAAGVSVGFWWAWTTRAAGDETGLFMVGAVLLGTGLAVGTALAALLGHAVRRRSARAAASP